MKHLILFRSILDLPPTATEDNTITGATSAKLHANLTGRFAEGALTTLYAQHMAVSGPTLPPMFDDEYTLDVLGTGWSAEALAQAEARIRPASARRMTTCPKCQQTSGNSWSQCDGVCPMPTSPHFRPIPIRDVIIRPGDWYMYKHADGIHTYEVVGTSDGAGISRCEQRVVYADVVTGKLYHRTKYDFVRRMEPVQ